MNGTWTTKPPPKILPTVLGALLIVIIVVLGLAHQGANGGRTVQISGQASTPAPSRSPSPIR